MSVSCPIGCGVYIDPTEVQHHFVSQCTRVQILCPYGCGQSFRRQALPDHETSCEVFGKLSSQYGIPLGHTVGDEIRGNALDAAWRSLRNLFKPRPPQPQVASALPARLKDSSKTSSAPPSPQVGRASPQIGHLERSASVPAAPLDPNRSSEPAIVSHIHSFLELYIPALIPYFNHGKDLYVQFRNGDEKTFWMTHALIVVVLFYLLSAIILFAFKLMVWSILMYSTGWTVYTSEIFSQNENAKKYAYVGTLLLGVYLFAVLQ